MRSLVPASYPTLPAQSDTEPAASRLATALSAAAAWAMRGALAVALAGAVVFVAGFSLPLSIDDGPAVAPALAVAVDAALLAAVCVAHAMTAGGQFRAWAARRINARIASALPSAILAAALIAAMFAWLPVGGTVWQVGAPWNSLVVAAMGLGFAGAAIAPFVAGELAANEPRRLARQAAFVPELVAAGLIVGIWATPTMTFGHLLLASVLTAYGVVYLISRRRAAVTRTSQAAPQGASLRFGFLRPGGSGPAWA